MNAPHPTLDIRSYMNLMEAERPHEGDPNVSYQEVSKGNEVHKVVATLTSFASGKYTKLAQNIARMQKVAEETLQLESEIKQDGREAVADLFRAEDAAYTRVVETVSFTLQIAKDPKAATTIEYKKVLEELQDHLTPELIAVLESIKAKFSTVQKPKPPSYSWNAKPDGVGVGETIDESGTFDAVSNFLKKYLHKIAAWSHTYDNKLNALKQRVSMHEQQNPISESSSTPTTVLSLIWDAVDQSHVNRVVELLDQVPQGSTMNIRSGGGIFEVSVKQIN